MADLQVAQQLANITILPGLTWVLSTMVRTGYIEQKAPLGHKTGIVLSILPPHRLIGNFSATATMNLVDVGESRLGAEPKAPSLLSASGT